MKYALQSVQAAAYGSAPITQDAATLWGQVFSDPIHLQGAPPGQPSFAQAMLNGVDQRLQVQPVAPQPNLLIPVGQSPSGGRADIFLTGSSAFPQSGLPTLPNADQALSTACAGLERLASLMSTCRLALVVQWTRLEPNEAAALTEVIANVPKLPVPPGSAELHYQVLQKRASVALPTNNLQILCRWFNSKQIQISPPVAGQGFPQISQHPASSCYIDLSTEPGLSPILMSSIPSIIAELKQEAEAIIDLGADQLG